MGPKHHKQAARLLKEYEGDDALTKVTDAETSLRPGNSARLGRTGPRFRMNDNVRGTELPYMTACVAYMTASASSSRKDDEDDAPPASRAPSGSGTLMR